MVQQPGGQCEVEAVDDAHREDVPQPPAVRSWAGGDLQDTYTHTYLTQVAAHNTPSRCAVGNTFQTPA